jgi:DNA-binding CsgD family transcriptional regulator
VQLTARTADPGPSRSATLVAAEAPDLVFYGEEQLVAAPGVRRPAAAPNLVNDLIEAASPIERRRMVQGMLHAIGFQWFGYGTVVLRSGRPVPRTFFTTYSHPDWTELYFRERFHEVDLRHQDAAPSSLPLVWDIDDVMARACAPQYTRRHRQFAEQLRDSGLHSGVFLSVASWTRPDERTVISLASAAPRRDWIVDGVLGQTLVLALSMHEFLSIHMQRADAAPTPYRSGLSPVQQQVLKAVLRGMSDKEIANSLAMSAHTVDYHMRQLRRQFGARNRVQLYNAAMKSFS